MRIEPYDPLNLIEVTRNGSRDAFELLSGFYARTVGRVDFKAGVELIDADFATSQQQSIVFPDGYELNLLDIAGSPTEAHQDRYYLDARFWPRGAFQFQAHAALVKTHDARLIDFGNEPTTLDLRLGVAWEPAAGHWLRAAVGRNTPRQVPFTLAPSTTLGLRENLLPAFYELLTPTDLAEQVDSAIARWDAEWTSHLFTAVEYQHQRFDALPISSPDGQIVFNGDTARINRLSATADIWATGNIGIALAGAWTDGHRAVPGSDGLTYLPFLPEVTARASLKWTNERRIAAQLSANYIGAVRDSFAARLGGYTVVNAGLQWEPFDKAIELRLDLFNLLDTDFRTTANAPGPGRALSGSVLVRF